VASEDASLIRTCLDELLGGTLFWNCCIGVCPERGVLNELKVDSLVFGLQILDFL